MNRVKHLHRHNVVAAEPFQRKVVTYYQDIYCINNVEQMCIVNMFIWDNLLVQADSMHGGASLTWSLAHVRVKALRFEHDEQGTPAQQHSREKQVFDDRRHRHPPAAGKSCGQGGSHRCWDRNFTWLAWLEDERRLLPGAWKIRDSSERTNI